MGLHWLFNMEAAIQTKPEIANPRKGWRRRWGRLAPAFLFFIVIIFPLINNFLNSALLLFTGRDWNFLFIVRDLWLYFLILIFAAKPPWKMGVAFGLMGIFTVFLYGSIQGLLGSQFNLQEIYFLFRNLSVFFLVACAKEISHYFKFKLSWIWKVLIVVIIVSLIELLLEYFYPGLVQNFIYLLPLYFAKKGIIANTYDGWLTEYRIVSVFYNPSQFAFFLGACFASIYLSYPSKEIIKIKMILMQVVLILLAIATVGKMGIALMPLSILFRHLRTRFCEMFMILSISGVMILGATVTLVSPGTHLASSLAHIDGLRTGLTSMLLKPQGLGLGAAGVVSTIGKDVGPMSSLPIGGESLIGAGLANQGIVWLFGIMLFFISSRKSIKSKFTDFNQELFSDSRYKFFMLFVISTAFNEGVSNPLIWTLPIMLIYERY